MAVFRVEKTQNYTVISNHHLRNATLILKAKGLLSQMLSLQENWNYTLKGLSKINRENVSAIRTAVQELEQYGCIVRRQGATSPVKWRQISMWCTKNCRKQNPLYRCTISGNGIPDNGKTDVGKSHPIK